MSNGFVIESIPPLELPGGRPALHRSRKSPARSSSSRSLSGAPSRPAMRPSAGAMAVDGRGAHRGGMALHNDFGRAAEDLAARYLEDRGWTVLHRNWRFRHKEIDLVVRKGGVVAFVEVRARRSATYGHPLATVGWRKRREVAAAARAWLVRQGCPLDTCRFDVVAVLDPAGRAGPGARVEHIPDAWRT
jgi:putative endonuclease